VKRNAGDGGILFSCFCAFRLLEQNGHFMFVRLSRGNGLRILPPSHHNLLTTYTLPASSLCMALYHYLPSSK